MAKHAANAATSRLMASRKRISDAMRHSCA